MRIASWIACGIFVLFAYLQLNDREQYGTELWWVWVLLYLATAAMSIPFVSRRLPSAAYLGAATAALLAAGIRALDITWEGNVFYNEANPAANEAGGLLVVCVWLGFVGWRLRRKTPSAR